MKINISAAVACAIVISAASAAPARPLIPLYDAATITARCDSELAKARATKKAIELRRMRAFLRTGTGCQFSMSDFAYPVYLLQNVAIDKATRDAAQTCLEKLLPFETEVAQSEPLYRRVRAVKPKDAIDQTFKQDLIEKFEDGGATLPPDKRKRAREIADEIERLDLQFGKNVNEDPTTVVLTPAEAAGMSDAWLAARKRDANGNLMLGLDYPTVVPFMQNATSEAARRKVWMAKNREGGEQNLALLDRTLKLRYELAQLHGLPDYATYAIKRRMAQTPAAVNEFLGQGAGGGRRSRSARTRGVACRQGEVHRHRSGRAAVSSLGLGVSSGACASRALQDRSGSTARVLSYRQEHSICDQARRAALWSFVCRAPTVPDGLASGCPRTY